jgi:hypothetical protein
MAKRKAAKGEVSPAEIGSLARSMVDARRRQLRIMEDYLHYSKPDAQAKLEEQNAAESVESLMEKAEDQVHWYDLDTLAEKDPGRAVELWASVKGRAREEWESGHRAAEVAHGWGGGEAWERARFLAIYEGMVEEVQPQGGIERALVEMLSQTHWHYLLESETLSMYETTELERMEYEVETTGARQRKAVWQENLEEKRAQRVEQLNRLFVRTLRALRDWRRYGSSVTIQRAGQVNIAEKQVNVANERSGEE